MLKKKNFIVLSYARENDANFMKNIHHWLDWLGLGFRLVMESRHANGMDQWIVGLGFGPLVLGAGLLILNSKLAK